MLKVTSLVSILLLTSPSFALSEQIAYETLKDNLIHGLNCQNEGREKEPFWKVMNVKTKIHMPAKINRLRMVTKVKEIPYNLKGSKFGCGVGKNGSIVIGPGRTESSIEYYETALDFISKGFSPIYVIDHVGQGFSPRLIKEDYHKAHIHDFNDYVTALDDFVKSVERDLDQVEGRKKQPLFYTSNSMGGGIGVSYFQKKGEANPFKAAAIVAPMLRVNYLGFPGGLSDAEENPNGVTCPTRIQNVLGSEAGVILNGIIQGKTRGYSAYSTSNARALEEQYGTAYVFGRRDFENSFAKAPEQVMTHSKERYEHKSFLWESNEMISLYDEMGLPSPVVAAPTVQWARESAIFNLKSRKKKNLKKISKNMPLSIITGENDARAYRPKKDCSHDMGYHIKFCERMNKAVGRGACTFNEIKGAYHEIYKESDYYRNQAIDKVVNHFLKSSKK